MKICPNSGTAVEFVLAIADHPDVDGIEIDLFTEGVERLTHSAPLSASQARRVAEDVTSWFSETVEELVQRRHRELQRQGLANEEIFARIAVEVEAWRFRAAPLSTRQLRRMVYG
jgi:hypothetical protein